MLTSQGTAFVPRGRASHEAVSILTSRKDEAGSRPPLMSVVGRLLPGGAPRPFDHRADAAEVFLGQGRPAGQANSPAQYAPGQAEKGMSPSAVWLNTPRSRSNCSATLSSVSFFLQKQNLTWSVPLS